MASLERSFDVGTYSVQHLLVRISGPGPAHRPTDGLWGETLEFSRGGGAREDDIFRLQALALEVALDISQVDGLPVQSKGRGFADTESLHLLADDGANVLFPVVLGEVPVTDPFLVHLNTRTGTGQDSALEKKTQDSRGVKGVVPRHYSHDFLQRPVLADIELLDPEALGLPLLVGGRLLGGPHIARAVRSGE